MFTNFLRLGFQEDLSTHTRMDDQRILGEMEKQVFPSPSYVLDGLPFDSAEEFVHRGHHQNPIPENFGVLNHFAKHRGKTVVSLY